MTGRHMPAAEPGTDEETHAAQRRAALRITIIGAIANVALAALKAAVGIIANSYALVADAVHSLSDLATDAVALAGVHLGRRPVDEDHPYGHGRIETLATLAIAALVVVAGLGIGSEAVRRLLAPPEQAPEAVALLAAALSIGAKEALYRLTVRVGRSSRSQLILANAVHHRSDAASSVAALLGIALSRLGVPLLDVLAGFAVALLILSAGLRMLWQAAVELIDTAPKALLEQVEGAVDEVEGVHDIHELMGRRVGPVVHVEVHVVVDPHISVSEGHQIAERVRHVVRDRFDEVGRVLVHVDTEEDLGPPRILPSREEVSRQLQEIAAAVGGVQGVSHLTLHYLGTSVRAEVTVLLDPDLRLQEAQALGAQVRAALRASALVEDADVHVEATPEV